MEHEIITLISQHQNLPAETIRHDSHLINDLGFTSLDLMQLVFALEEHYGIEMDEEDMTGLLTIEKISLYVGSKMAQKKHAS
jgi:acyl carrier protein